MSLRRSLALFVLALAALAAGGNGTWAAFSSTTSTGPGSFSSAPDWTAPSVTASVIANSSSGPGVKASGTYNVYANVSDFGNPPSGVSTVTASLSSITTGQTAVALTACSSGCTVAGTTYGYKSASLTANAGISGTLSYTVTPKDAAGNTGSAGSYSVTVDNTLPAVTAAVAGHASAGAWIKKSGTYFIYANATDTGSGVGTVTADVSNITAGQTAVPLSACSSSCTVAGTSYSYKSASLTADSTVAANKTYTVTATDAAGNSSSATSFAATVDNTQPTASSVATANGGSRTGLPEANDTVTLTFSEQVDPDTVLSGWSGSSTPIVVRIRNAGGTADDFVTFWDPTNTSQLPLGNVDLGGAGYVATGSSITFGATGTASSMVQSGSALTITLGTANGTTNRVNSKTTMIWNSTTTPADLAGNLATGNSFTATAARQF